MSNSLGGINHAYHAWLWIGICFMFLPDPVAGRSFSRQAKLSYLTVISMAQALLLSFYSLAGFWKILGGVSALLHGYEGNFSAVALSNTLADRMLQTGTSPLLANFVIDNTWLSSPMFLILIYAQLSAIVVALRPRLHLLWGYLLLGFHLGTWLLMEIAFAQHVLFLALFFILSPFRPTKVSVRELLLDLPIVGGLFRFASPRLVLISGARNSGLEA